MNPVEKRKVDIRDTTALDNFKDNLTTDGTYTVHQDVLDKSFKALPHHMRNADLTMVAGAYKTGSIAMFDKDGDIVDLGFSRSSLGYGYLNSDMREYAIDTPVLDLFHYKQSITGYIVEEERVRVVNGLYSGLYNPAMTQKPNTTITSMTSYSKSGIGKATVNNSSVGVDAGFHMIPIPSSVGWRKVRLFIKRFGSIQYNLYYTAGNTPARHIYLDLEKNLISLTNSSIRNSKLYEFEEFKVFEFEVNAPGSTRFWFSHEQTLEVIGDGASGIEVGWFTIALDTKELGSYIHYQGTDYVRGADTISAITLTNDAVIHIKTAKGVQDFVLNTGSTFNVNDYITNDKLICFAIKYLPDIEVFIAMLGASSYTYDDDVIRDSWSSLLNRANTDSTFRNALCNADHVVIPYAYRTGYVAAMNLEDGSIVELEFERASNGYGYLNGDMIEYSSHSIISDLFHYKSDEIGFVFEEERPMLLAYPYSSLSSSITGNSMLNATITNMSSYNWAGVGKVRPNAFTNDYARFNLNSMSNGWHKFRLFVKRYGSKDYDLAYQTGNNAFNHVVTFNLTTNIATILRPFVIRNAIVYDYEGYKVIEFESNHETGSGRFFFRYNNSDYFDSDGLSGIEIGWLNVALPDTEFNSYIHYQGSNYTKNKDRLKTESYSKVTTVGVSTGIRTGKFTDPQSLVQNDKINFIFLKQ